MSEVDPRIAERIRGPAWAEIRESFVDLCERVLNVAPKSRAELTTIYVKFVISHEPMAPVYAVAWLKTAKNVVIGFALPEAVIDGALTEAPAGMMYKGLTKYFRLSPGVPLPPSISEWARLAFDEVNNASASDKP